MARRRPKALVTAPVAGPGLDLLRQVADVVVDPWIDHQPLRIYNADQLAERAAEEDANLLVVEADRCAGPVFERDLIAVCSCRGDPNNVDVDAATKAGVPVLRAPGRTPTPWPSSRSACCSPRRGGSWPRTTTSGRARSTRTAPSLTSVSGRGSSQGEPQAWSVSEPWAGPRSGGSRDSACR